MDTNRLHQFCVLAECGNMREAARLLGISHSGLSKAMKALEHDLDVTLLVPEGRGIAITDAGKRTYHGGRRLLRELDDFLGRCRGAPASAPELRIGTFEVFSTYFLGEFVETERPEGPLLVRELTPGPLEQALVDGHVDLGITYLPIPRPELTFTPVCSLEMDVFGHPKFAETPYDEWPFCAPTIPVTGTPTRAKGLDGWPDDDLPRMIRFHVDMMEAALELCRRGLAVVYLPVFIAALHNRHASRKGQLASLPRPRGLRANRPTVHLVRRKASPEARLERQLARRLRVTTRLSV